MIAQNQYMLMLTITLTFRPFVFVISQLNSLYDTLYILNIVVI